MSIENVEQFVTDIKTNAELEEKLKDVVGASAMVEVANRHGHEITEADMRAYVAKRKTELSDRELDGVLGGLAWSRHDEDP